MIIFIIGAFVAGSIIAIDTPNKHKKIATGIAIKKKTKTKNYKTS
jgi:hypothetical protein